MNMSEYIHNNENMTVFWYNNFIIEIHDQFTKGKLNPKNIILNILNTYLKFKKLNSNKKILLEKYIRLLKEKEI